MSRGEAFVEYNAEEAQRYISVSAAQRMQVDYEG